MISVWNGTKFRSKYIGSFGTEIEAARAYDDEARRIYGPLANCNFPLEQDDDDATRETTGLQGAKETGTNIPF